MTLDAATVARLAERLDRAERDVRPVARITDEYTGIDAEDAYAIQRALRDRKVAHGASIAGLKMGLTSHAKMKQLGVDTSIYGFLTEEGRRSDGAAVRTKGLIRPRVEPEIAFSLKARLAGPGCDVNAVLAATDYVVSALEIIDSRYEEGRFDLRSVIADNASCACFVVGARRRHAADLDLMTLGVVLEKNGLMVATGSGADVLGHPAAAVAMLANMLAARGEHVPAGSFILSGGITEAVPVTAGDRIEARFEELGSVAVTFD